MGPFADLRQFRTPRVIHRIQIKQDSKIPIISLVIGLKEPLIRVMKMAAQIALECSVQFALHGMQPTQKSQQ
jgi:hypothetical protein